jgi:hypothetical protein
MPVDNFEIIKSLLKFDSEDDFYHLQILKRKKENPELGSNSYVVKTYYVTSVEYLEKKKDEIINLCQFHNARACINLNPRSFEKVAFHTMKKVTDIIMNKDFKSVRKAYESVCGEFGNGKHKSWIVDIDVRDLKEIGKVLDMIEPQQPEGVKLIALLETKNGYHLIVRPFDKSKVELGHDLHKNNPTILYIS